MTNLYWPVYKNIEKEVLELSYNIYFDDIQFEYTKDSKGDYLRTPPYSLNVGELLVRCCTEIEAIIKELTRGKEEKIKLLPDIDNSKPITTGCQLKYLHHIWGLDKKTVIISCASMFFQKEQYKSFLPFKYTQNDEDDYYSAYNAIKHNRSIKTIYKGNIRYLLRALGALYLLNLYYKNEIIYLGKNSNISSVPSNSEIFSVKTIRVAMTERDDSVKIAYGNFKSAVSAVYMIKTSSEFMDKHSMIVDNYSKELNKKIIEISRISPNITQTELMQKVIRSVPSQSFNKSSENKEYEAIIVKPEKIAFYESIGCKDKYTPDELIQIEKEIGFWK